MKCGNKHSAAIQSAFHVVNPEDLRREFGKL